MKKNTSGFTLVELILSVAILAVVTAYAAMALYSSIHSYAITKQLQDEQYNARMALLAITREAHRGVKVSNIAGEETSTATGGVLTLINASTNAEIQYRIGADGRLSRTILSGLSTVPFTPVELTRFAPTIERQVYGENSEFERYWLRIEIEGQYGLNLSTKISLSRIPMSVN